MRILHSFIVLFLLGSFVASADTEFVVHDGRVYNVTTEVIAADEVGTAIGEITVESDEIQTGASNVYPVGTFLYDIQGTNRSEAIAVEVSSGEFVKATYSEANEGGFSLWTLMLGIVGILIIAVGMMSFRNQRSHVKQYKD